MPKTNRGWTMGSQCKPAAEYDMRVARGLLQRESARLASVCDCDHA